MISGVSTTMGGAHGGMYTGTIYVGNHQHMWGCGGCGDPLWTCADLWGGYLAGLRGVLAGCLRIASNSGKRFPKAVGATWDSGSFAGIFINE